MTEKFANANGLSLAYDEFGQSHHPAILLIMGLGTQMIAWPEPFCERLAEHGYRVIRFDNRDIGLSEKVQVKRPVSVPRLMLRARLGLPLDVPYTLRDMASDTAGLMNALEINQAHLVGASMGGMIAQIFAAEFAERCLSLTSVMSSSGNPSLPTSSWRVSRQLLNRPMAGERAILNHAKKTWAMIGSPDYPPTEQEVEERVLRALRRSHYPAGYRNQMAAILESGDRRPLLRRIRIPTLVIHGKADVLVPVTSGIDTAENIRGAKLKLIEGMGHDLPRELIPRLARMIAGHLEESSEAGTGTRSQTLASSAPVL